jgi:DNA-binding NtrC family response regulator
MPDMNGEEVIQIVRERFPLMLRIIHSANPDAEAVLKTSDVCHHFFHKPCELEALRETLERSFLKTNLLKESLSHYSTSGSLHFTVEK